MNKIKQLFFPLLFILFSSLLVGLSLFYIDFVYETEANGEPNPFSHSQPGAKPLNSNSSETLACKNETVYVVLNPEGRVIDQRIVNRIYQGNNEKAGKIKDYGDYDTINNMTSEATPDLRDNIILWDSNLLEEGDIYYEGITDKNLPVDFQIDYYLDGKKVEAAALEGKSGRLRIVIKIKNNLESGGTVAYQSYDGKIARKKDLNYVPLLVQGTFTADLNRFSEIKATDGTGIITGQNINVSFMAFPYPEAEIILTMKGEKIKLNQIMMMIIPQLPPIPDLDMEDDLVKMLEGITTIEKGLNELYVGADQIFQGLDLFRTKTNELLTQMEPLLSLIEEWPRFSGNLKEGAIRRQLDSIREFVERMPGERPGGLPDPINWPEDWPEDWSGDWPEEWPGNRPEEWLDNLPEDLHSYLNELIALTEKFDDLEDYISRAEESFEQVAALPEAINQLADGQKQIRDGLGEINNRGIVEMKKGLIDGVNENRFGKAKIELMRSLAEGYRSHADNNHNLSSSVQFIIQTEATAEQKTELSDKEGAQDSPDKAWYLNLWSRFKDLFTLFSFG